MGALPLGGGGGAGDDLGCFTANALLVGGGMAAVSNWCGPGRCSRELANLRCLWLSGLFVAGVSAVRNVCCFRYCPASRFAAMVHMTNDGGLSLPQSGHSAHQSHNLFAAPGPLAALDKLFFHSYDLHVLHVVPTPVTAHTPRAYALYRVGAVMQCTRPSPWHSSTPSPSRTLTASGRFPSCPSARVLQDTAPGLPQPSAAVLVHALRQRHQQLTSLRAALSAHTQTCEAQRAALCAAAAQLSALCTPETLPASLQQPLCALRDCVALQSDVVTRDLAHLDREAPDVCAPVTCRLCTLHRPSHSSRPQPCPPPPPQSVRQCGSIGSGEAMRG